MQGARGLSGPILRRRSPPYCCTSSLAVSLRSRPCRSLLRVRRSSISLRAAWIGSKGSGVSGIAFGGGASSIRGSGWAPSGPVSPAPGSTEPPRAVRHALKRRRRSQTRIPMGGGQAFRHACAAVSADSSSETRFVSLSREATSSRIMCVMLAASARYSSSSATTSASAAGSWLCAGASSRLGGGGLGGGGSAPRPRPRDDVPRPRLPRPFDPPSTMRKPQRGARIAADQRGSGRGQARGCSFPRSEKIPGVLES